MIGEICIAGQHITDLPQVPEEGKLLERKDNPPGAAPFLLINQHDKKFFQELDKMGYIYIKLGIFVAALVAELVKMKSTMG